MKSKKKSKKIYIILLVVCLLVMAGLVAGLFGYAHYMGTKTMGSRIKIFGEDVSGRSVEETAGMLADDFKKVPVTFQGGLGYGDNTKAALITRGIAEISRLGIAMGAHARTFYGLSGIGDLIVTCASVHSRNRKAGYLMGKGYTMQEAMDEVKMVVEGVYSAKAALGLAEKYGVEMPIIAEVNKVLFEDKSAADAVNELMQRMKKDELGVELWDDEK